MLEWAQAIWELLEQLLFQKSYEIFLLVAVGQHLHLLLPFLCIKFLSCEMVLKFGQF